MRDPRKAIIDELKRQSRSRWWLAQRMAAKGHCRKAETVMAYLRGDTETKIELYRHMAATLGLELAHKSLVMTKSQKKHLAFS